jgi:hypothetical protein
MNEINVIIQRTVLTIKTDETNSDNSPILSLRMD